LSKRKFEKLLLVAVDEGLSSLGESSRQAIYSYLDKNFRIKRQEIPRKIEAFAGAIENIFGQGASLLEILIMQKLHDKVGQQIKWQTSKDLTLAEYVSVAKQSFLNKEEINEEQEEFVQCKQILTENQ
jgi:hypothetical protein